MDLPNSIHPDFLLIQEKFDHVISSPLTIHEPSPSYPKLKEHEIQAKFFAGEFGNTWKTDCGKNVKIFSPGFWNREAGPDFHNAIVSFNSHPPTFGDIEIDIESKAWESHQHHINPDFENVILHFYFIHQGPKFFARTLSNRHVPQIQLPLDPQHNPPPFPTSNPSPLQNPVEAIEIIKFAALYRLLKKAKKFSLRSALHGHLNALYQCLAEGLGYKRNSLPMLLLAQKTLHISASHRELEAILFGLAGFLDNNITIRTSSENYLSSLWSYWWKLRDEFCKLTLTTDYWKFSSTRPQNHPHRRVAALAAIRQILPPLWHAIESNKKDLFISLLTDLYHPFWSHHWSFSSAFSPKQSALIGKNRCIDLLVNIFYPCRICLGADPTSITSELSLISTPSLPQKIKSTKEWLCPNILDKQLHNACFQQGLLELANDLRNKTPPLELGKLLPQDITN
ncbi:MAG: DUF2851 family protein [Chthoniobacterales bacterium]|nr:DUF2851 family protein [Chthoniobacterales bacterium]